jgi:Rad3-related DNA helicase
MSMEIPNTQATCDGCGKDLNLLAPHLNMVLRAKREVLISEEVASEDPNEVGDANIYLGTKSGAGTICVFHDYDCMSEWVEGYAGEPAKLELHAEDAIYVPEDNPDDEEIARRKAAEEDEG